jgi:hypothetical protein
MARPVLVRAVPRRLAFGLTFCAVLTAAAGARAYTTTSPLVARLVQRAVAYLEKANDETRAGGKAVIALALLKNRAPLDHPKIVEAAKAVQDSIKGGGSGLDIYGTGVSVIFLVTYDPDKYRPEIEALLKSLQSTQKPHGGWGYHDKEQGDTSMTQYGVLGYWEAKQVGFEPPLASVEAMTRFLLKTQDPSGAWGYQGILSSSYQPVEQQDVRHSLAAAGLGSMYICADLLGLTPTVAPRDESLPAALTESVSQQAPAASGLQTRTNVDPNLIRAAQKRGNDWMAKEYKINPVTEPYYYMYALERYCSFRELAEGKAGVDPAKVEGPKWYNDGVEFLRDSQKDDGGWNDPTGQCGQPVNTAFGVLFLLRSMQKSIQRARGFGEGTLVGGRGLPKDGGDVVVQGGNVVPKPILAPFEALKAAMERDEAGAEDLTAAVERMEKLPPKESQLLVSEYQKKLDKLLSNPSPEKRIAAVKMLGRSGDLDNVPMLIRALDDRDAEVMLAARDGLRRLSRKFNGFGMPDEPTDQQRSQAIEKWKAWYLSIRPDTEF